MSNTMSSMTSCNKIVAEPRFPPIMAPNDLKATQQPNSSMDDLSSTAAKLTLDDSSSPWSFPTNSGFATKTGKLGGKWNFNQMLRNKRDKATGAVPWYQSCSGPQNDLGILSAKWKL